MWSLLVENSFIIGNFRVKCLELETSYKMLILQFISFMIGRGRIFLIRIWLSISNFLFNFILKAIKREIKNIEVQKLSEQQIHKTKRKILSRAWLLKNRHRA